MNMAKDIKKINKAIKKTNSAIESCKYSNKKSKKYKVKKHLSLVPNEKEWSLLANSVVETAYSKESDSLQPDTSSKSLMVGSITIYRTPNPSSENGYYYTAELDKITQAFISIERDDEMPVALFIQNGDVREVPNAIMHDPITVADFGNGDKLTYTSLVNEADYNANGKKRSIHGDGTDIQYPNDDHNEPIDIETEDKE